jgi:hypothetical protein
MNNFQFPVSTSEAQRGLELLCFRLSTHCPLCNFDLRATHARKLFPAALAFCVTLVCTSKTSSSESEGGASLSSFFLHKATVFVFDYSQKAKGSLQPQSTQHRETGGLGLWSASFLHFSLPLALSIHLMNWTKMPILLSIHDSFSGGPS